MVDCAAKTVRLRELQVDRFQEYAGAGTPFSPAGRRVFGVTNPFPGQLLRALAAWLFSTVIALTLLTAPACAQTPAAPPSADKVEQLLRLLDDPAVKSWLAAQHGQAAGGAAVAPPDAAANVDMGMMSAMLDRVKTHMTRIATAWPLLPERFEAVRGIMMKEVDDKGGLGVAILILLFVGVGSVFSYITFRLAAPLRLWTIARDKDTPQGRVGKFGGRFLLGGLMVGAFTVGSAGAFLMFDWPPLLREVVLAYLTAAIAIWSVRILSFGLLMPSFAGAAHARAVRAFDITDARADHWFRWIGIFTAAAAVEAATFSLLPRFGFNRDDILALSVPVDLLLLGLALAAVWRRPAARAEDGERLPRFGHAATTWLLTAYFILLFLIRTGGTHALFWFAVATVGLPAAIVLATRAVNYVLRPPESDAGAPPLPAVTVAAIDRALRLGLIVLAAYLLAKIWGLDMSSMEMRNPTTTILLRGFLNAVVILLAADFAWSIIKAVIQRKLGVRPLAHGEEESLLMLDPQQARLRTLLPIIQNILFAVIVILSILMVLSSVGIQIGPLIAGAGVVGIAVGFGAQTLVKDVISGVFYLLDDAFRVGEYISSGKYTGTVESFSLRSVKLRHHRGPLFTVPFGQLGAVRNESRDWSIDKFNITVGFDTDLEAARKLIKRIGLELAEDPEFKPWVIEPIKMQGVQEFGEYGIVLRMKVTTRPGGAFAMKRKFYLRVSQVFRDNNIELPVPTVHIQGHSPGVAPAPAEIEAAAAQAYLAHQNHKKAAAEAEEETEAES